MPTRLSRIVAHSPPFIGALQSESWDAAARDGAKKTPRIPGTRQVEWRFNPHGMFRRIGVPLEMVRNSDGKTNVNVGTSSAAPQPGQPSLDSATATASEEEQTMSAIAERSDPIFDRWLESELQTQFGSVAAEPVPENLLKIIELHRSNRS